MTRRRAIVIGLGKRVREAVLPAFEQASDLWEVDGVFARSEREETVGDRTYSVRPLGTLDRAALDGADLVYLAVGKDAVPKVLRTLADLQPSETDLLIDTPVVRFKHFHHAKLADAFRIASVPEDCAYLPWFDVVRAAALGGTLGTPRTVHFDRSAYAYHGLASGKALLSAGRVASGKRTVEGSTSVRRLRLKAKGAAPTGAVSIPESGGRAELIVTEPRDYATGCIRMDGDAGSVTDDAARHPDATLLAPAFGTLAGTHVVTGFRCGDHLTELDEPEQVLTAGVSEGQSIIAMQEAMKRVGLLRILRDVHAGRGGYSLIEGIDDMVVDYHLEKFRRYVAQPLTSARSPLARALLGTMSRFAGR